MEAIIAFLITNKTLIGSIVSILEGIVVCINLWKKFVGRKKGEVASMAASPSIFKGFLHVINPVNCFR